MSTKIGHLGDLVTSGTLPWVAPKSRGIAVCGVIGFALLTALGAQIRVPLPNTPIPMTLQTLAVILSGLALGSRLGLASQSLYIFLGVVGLPVFAYGDAGPAYLFGPTGGYLLGFLVAAYVAGLITKGSNSNTLSIALASLLATILIFAMGVGWIWMTNGNLLKALELGFYPFILGACLKWVAAAVTGGLFLSSCRKIW